MVDDVSLLSARLDAAYNNAGVQNTVAEAADAQPAKTLTA